MAELEGAMGWIVGVGCKERQGKEGGESGGECAVGNVRWEIGGTETPRDLVCYTR